MVEDKWQDDWQRQEKRFEPAIILTLTLGMAIAIFLATTIKL